MCFKPLRILCYRLIFWNKIRSSWFKKPWFLQCRHIRLYVHVLLRSQGNCEDEKPKRRRLRALQYFTIRMGLLPYELGLIRWLVMTDCLPQLKRFKDFFISWTAVSSSSLEVEYQSTLSTSLLWPQRIDAMLLKTYILILQLLNWKWLNRSPIYAHFTGIMRIRFHYLNEAREVKSSFELIKHTKQSYEFDSFRRSLTNLFNFLTF